MRMELSLAPGTRAPAEARGSLARLAPELERETHERLRLVVTELVSNSVRHAGLRPEDRILLELEVKPHAVRGAVRDPGEGFREPATGADPERVGQWGLFLVDRLADRWGVGGEDGARVWFELDRPQGRS